MPLKERMRENFASFEIWTIDLTAIEELVVLGTIEI
jgi:hypothetical protein